jgi:hypothetical protein
VSEAPTTARAPVWPAYAIAGLTTLLWVGCSLPAGIPLGGSLSDDAGTPLHRQPWALVPGLVLLVLMPVAMTLTVGRQGRLGVLAATDAFLTLYAGLVLTFRSDVPDPLQPRGLVALLLLAALYVLGVLSIAETRRVLRGELGAPAGGLGGARLALCLLVLVVPAWPLLVPGQERASLLAPFLFVAVSAAGARLARGPAGLAFTAAVLHLALAAHVLVSLRFTVLHDVPRIPAPGPVGRATLDACWVLLALAVAQVLLFLPGAVRRRAAAPSAA